MMTDQELSYKGIDPGAVQYGNFINYYSFHSSRSRLDNLDPLMFPSTDDSDSYICLDIGCNTGELTRNLHDYISSIFPNKEIYILGIDIDPALIDRAKDNTIRNIYFQNMDIMNEDSISVLNSFLKKYNKIAFDVIFCFSVTMWIHLNHGDKGLVQFIDLMKDNTRTLIVESQPWRCYKTAYRRMKRSKADFPLFRTIKIRENVECAIENKIVQDNFVKIVESSPSSWNRKVQSFKRVN